MASLEFNQLLVNNAEFLKPFAITLTRDSEAAKDLFQETLYRALANKDKYNVGTNIKAWLYTIMRNIFINNYRRKAKQNTIFDSSPANEFLLNSNQAAVASRHGRRSVACESIYRQQSISYPRYFVTRSCSILTGSNIMRSQKCCRNRSARSKAAYILPVNC